MPARRAGWLLEVAESACQRSSHIIASDGPGRQVINNCQSSEHQLQRELRQSWSAIPERIPVGHIGGAGAGAEGGTVDGHVRQSYFLVSRHVSRQKARLPLRVP